MCIREGTSCTNETYCRGVGDKDKEEKEGRGRERDTGRRKGGSREGEHFPQRTLFLIFCSPAVSGGAGAPAQVWMPFQQLLSSWGTPLSLLPEREVLGAAEVRPLPTAGRRGLGYRTSPGQLLTPLALGGPSHRGGPLHSVLWASGWQPPPRSTA